MRFATYGQQTTYSLFNQGPYTYANVTSLSVSLALLLNDHTSHIMRHETDKEVTFVYVCCAPVKSF